MTKIPTSPRDFDDNDFITPDILQAVNKNVRAATNDVLSRSGFGEGAKKADAFFDYSPSEAVDTAANTGQEPDSKLDEVLVEIPKIPDINEDLDKIKIDMLRFNRKQRFNVRILLFVVVVVIIETLLSIYLLNQ
ncbi:MAG: hypothetical protein LBS91_09810 [Clostridiales Family XIII bacterium]|nr:hypothetical protein [Clostridiales Family XIII bacterium]